MNTAPFMRAAPFRFAEGLKLLAQRAELMDRACRSTSGGMASVLSGDPEVIREVCAACGIDVANFNSPGQIVISGEKEKLAEAVEELKNRGMRKVIVLNVAGAFHSRLMAPARRGAETGSRGDADDGSGCSGLPQLYGRSGEGRRGAQGRTWLRRSRARCAGRSACAPWSRRRRQP